MFFALGKNIKQVLPLTFGAAMRGGLSAAFSLHQARAVGLPGLFGLLRALAAIGLPRLPIALLLFGYLLLFNSLSFAARLPWVGNLGVLFGGWRGLVFRLRRAGADRRSYIGFGSLDRLCCCCRFFCRFAGRFHAKPPQYVLGSNTERRVLLIECRHNLRRRVVFQVRQHVRPLRMAGLPGGKERRGRDDILPALRLDALRRRRQR